jgi:NDP-sugar pyrophosphorylase family protein
MKAVLLAAGRSERLRGFRRGLPKVLLRVNGESILERNLRYLREAGVREVFINLHYKPGLIRKALRGHGGRGMKIVFSPEKELRGTAGAVKLVERHLRGADFIVLYGDNLLDLDIGKMAAVHRRSRAWLTIGAYDPRRTHWSGIAAGLIRTDKRGKVLTFEERRSNDKIGPNRVVNAGLLLVSPKALKMIPGVVPFDFSRDLFPLLLKQGRRLQTAAGASYVLASDTLPAWRETCRIARKVMS